MAPKKLAFDEEARRALERGVDTVANAVKVTLGPKGRNVVIEKKWGSPVITKDGVTVTKEIELDDQYENMGAQLCKEVASKTNDDTGDGTTTATVLAQGIVHAGLKNVAAGANPMLINAGSKNSEGCWAIRAHAIPVEARRDRPRAGIAGNDWIGEIIADAMEKVGKDGVITVEESKVGTTEVEVVEGMQFDKGYISPYFATDGVEAVLEDAYILLYEGKITSAADIVPVMEKVAAANRPLLVVAESVEAEALATMVVNNMRGTVLLRRQGPGWRPPQAQPRGHRHPHRWHVYLRGSGHQARQRAASGPRRAKRIVVTRMTPPSSRRGQSGGDRCPGGRDPPRDQHHRLRLRP